VAASVVVHLEKLFDASITHSSKQCLHWFDPLITAINWH